MSDPFGIFKAARESFWPVLTTSAFVERGVLTPEEFVKAGDQLVQMCGTWHWESGNPANIKAYLPKDKQYLSIRKVPSYRRVTSLQSASVKESMIESQGSGGDWCSTDIVEHISVGLGEGVIVDVTDLLTENPEGTEKVETVSAPAVVEPISNKETDEYLEFEEDDSLGLDALSVSNASKSTAKSGVVYARRYDVNITYDKYYQTPRIWLFGYDEAGNPLPPSSIFDDIMQDYAKKTVTIDPHPHLDTLYASIHPCQHAAAMLRIINALKDCGKTPKVEQYMFIFLKFMQSVMPTIEYDFTFDVQVRESG